MAKPALSELALPASFGVETDPVAGPLASETATIPPAEGVGAQHDKAVAIQTAIMMKVSAALLAEPPSALTIIEVDYEQGVVTLSGQVASDEISALAEEIAAQYPGVTSAINALEVRSLLED